MAEFPALPLWTDAYLADTRHLSTVEHGAYLLLLMEMWRRPHCNLPDDDKILSRLAGLSIEEWEEIKPVLMDLWTVKNGHWRHIGRCTRARVRKTLPLALREEVRVRDQNKCRYCGNSNGPFNFDHVLPWSRGGTDEINNIVLACVPCNQAKSDLTIEELGIAHPLEGEC